MARDPATFDTDVLVVGSGPAGATAALALASYGLDVIALNKYRSTATDPRAHIFNQRGMEVLRDFGLEREAMALATPHELMRNEVFCTSLVGQELSRFESWHTHPDVMAQHDLASPCSMVDLNQQILEPILITEAARRGAHMRTETEVVRLDQDDTGVTATVRDRLNEHEYTIRSRYLVGADGANSRVVSELGLPVEGEVGLGRTLGVTFRADLGHLMEHRAGDLYWMIQQGEGVMGYSIGGLRLVRAWDRWVASVGLKAGEPLPNEAAATAVVHRILGDDTIPVEIEGLKTWTINRLWAKSISKGRVFVVGDAIHRHPPMNGLGSNTSMQDAFNVAWKLAMVVKGQAATALLDSFELERQPVAESVVKKTHSTMISFFPRIADALGLRRGGQTQEEIDEQLAGLAAPTSEGAARRRKWRAAVEGTLQASSSIGGEFNVLYRSGAVIDDGIELRVDDPALMVIVGLQSGRRLPHAWLTRDQRRISTLDLCGHGQFTLLTGSQGAQAWRAAAALVSGRLGAPLTVRAIGLCEDVQDPYGDFARLCLPNESGAVLVRPDHVVAWHVEEAPTAPGEELLKALSAILGRHDDPSPAEATILGEVVAGSSA